MNSPFRPATTKVATAPTRTPSPLAPSPLAPPASPFRPSRSPFHKAGPFRQASPFQAAGGGAGGGGRGRSPFASPFAEDGGRGPGKPRSPFGSPFRPAPTRRIPTRRVVLLGRSTPIEATVRRTGWYMLSEAEIEDCYEGGVQVMKWGVGDGIDLDDPAQARFYQDPCLGSECGGDCTDEHELYECQPLEALKLESDVPYLEDPMEYWWDDYDPDHWAELLILARDIAGDIRDDPFGFCDRSWETQIYSEALSLAGVDMGSELRVDAAPLGDDAVPLGDGGLLVGASAFRRTAERLAGERGDIIDAIVGSVLTQGACGLESEGALLYRESLRAFSEEDYEHVVSPFVLTYWLWDPERYGSGHRYLRVPGRIVVERSRYVSVVELDELGGKPVPPWYVGYRELEVTHAGSNWDPVD